MSTGVLEADRPSSLEDLANRIQENKVASPLSSIARSGRREFWFRQWIERKSASGRTDYVGFVVQTEDEIRRLSNLGWLKGFV